MVLRWGVLLGRFSMIWSTSITLFVYYFCLWLIINHWWTFYLFLWISFHISQLFNYSNKKNQKIKRKENDRLFYLKASSAKHFLNVFLLIVIVKKVVIGFLLNDCAVHSSLCEIHNIRLEAIIFTQKLKLLFPCFIIFCIRNTVTVNGRMKGHSLRKLRIILPVSQFLDYQLGDFILQLIFVQFFQINYLDLMLFLSSLWEKGAVQIRDFLFMILQFILLWDVFLLFLVIFRLVEDVFVIFLAGWFWKIWGWRAFWLFSFISLFFAFVFLWLFALLFSLFPLLYFFLYLLLVFEVLLILFENSLIFKIFDCVLICGKSVILGLNLENIVFLETFLLYAFVFLVGLYFPLLIFLS